MVRNEKVHPISFLVGQTQPAISDKSLFFWGEQNYNKTVFNMDPTTSMFVSMYAISALTFLLSICRRGSLRKRPREEGPSFEPDSKRAKLDEARTSSSNPVAPELVPEPEAAPEVMPEPQASPTSTTSTSCFSYDSDHQSITALDDQESVFNSVCRHFEDVLATSGKALPEQWSLQDFSRAVIGEEEVQDLPYLIDVLSDLSLHGLQSWYWEEAVKFLTLITSSGIF